MFYHPIHGRKRNIVRNRPDQHQALAAAILTKVCNSIFNRFAVRLNRHGLAVYSQLARAKVINAAHRAGQFGLARADQAGDAKNLPLAQVEADTLIFIENGRHVPGFQHNLIGRITFLCAFLDLFSGHHCNQIFRRHFRDFPCLNFFAVAQHSHTITNFI